MILGVGSFAHGVGEVLTEQGAEVHTYFTRDGGRYGPGIVGPTYASDAHPNLCKLLRELAIDCVIPMSIDWNRADWVEEFLELGIPIISPAEEGIRLERDRHFGKDLCARYSIPYPKAFVAKNRLEAEKILDENPMPFVIKNTLCSPTSPVHTILCESMEDTRSWLRQVDYAEGVFLQEYLDSYEAGHIAFVSGGEIYSMVSNLEYKRAFDGNMGVLAGVPLGGIVEMDNDDKYGLARELLHPLLPWFREVNFHGPVQVTAMRHRDRWHVLEYNVRIGVTCGPVIWKMLKNPLEVLADVSTNRAIEPRFNDDVRYACSLTLAGYGYPFTQIAAPKFPVEALGEFDCYVWWNQVAETPAGTLALDGHRIADVVSIQPTLEEAIENAYDNIAKIRCLSSYYRTDIGKSLWPPGSE